MIRIFCLQFDKNQDGDFDLHLTVGEAVEESLGFGFIVLVFGHTAIRPLKENWSSVHTDLNLQDSVSRFK